LVHRTLIKRFTARGELVHLLGVAGEPAPQLEAVIGAQYVDHEVVPLMLEPQVIVGNTVTKGHGVGASAVLVVDGVMAERAPEVVGIVAALAGKRVAVAGTDRQGIVTIAAVRLLKPPLPSVRVLWPVASSVVMVTTSPLPAIRVLSPNWIGLTELRSRRCPL
jgi:hypothetical protein